MCSDSWTDQQREDFGNWASALGRELREDDERRARAAEAAKQSFVSRQVCPGCPLQQLLDCAGSDVVDFRMGSSGAYVRVADAEGRQAEVMLDDGEVEDSDTARAILEEANNHVTTCAGPGQTRWRKRPVCSAGILFRQVPPREVAYEDQVRRAVADSGAAITRGSNPFNGRFKNT